MAVISKQLEIGGKLHTIETGKIATQADGAVLVQVKDTIVLVTAVGSKEPSDNTDFFPLRVDYQVKAGAYGKVPGGFLKREGRPSDKETLTARLIDRTVRPLFPENFTQDVQIIITVLSVDPEIDPDIPAMIGAAAALKIGGFPIVKDFAGVRVGLVDGQFVLNPTQTELKQSDLDLVVSGSEDSILMVESEAKEISKEQMLQAFEFAKSGIKESIKLIDALAKDVNIKEINWHFNKPVDAELIKKIQTHFLADFENVFAKKIKQERNEANKQLLKKVISDFEVENNNLPEDKRVCLKEAAKAYAAAKSNFVRNNISKHGKRIGDRKLDEVRPIAVETGFLPRVHGASLFTRGETQALVCVTLGSSRDAQLLESPFGEQRDTFMLHYNFPPYSVGEIGNIGSPKRREIGHGYLARRAIESLLPNEKEFPYTVRAVSEIVACNGSSSMATVCGTSLALLDAGVPLKRPVAGIAMGLIIDENNKHHILTDILGDEDALGDMDFKVAGTEKGITALQMDIKVYGISQQIMQEALDKAEAGKNHILKIMNLHLSEARDNLSKYAPRIVSFKINPDKIRDVIGKGGSTIQAITKETGATIEIQDDGTVQISAVGEESINEARHRVEILTLEVKIGDIFDGKVVKIVDFGAFVSIAPGKEGLVHISQLSKNRVNTPNEVVHEGQEVKVKVLEIDKFGKLRLSMRAVSEVS